MKHYKGFNDTEIALRKNSTLMQTVAMVITWNHCDFSKNIFEEHVTLLTLKKSRLY